MSDAYNNIIPQRFVLPEFPIKYEQQIIVNWLEREVPHEPMLILDDLTGWRNKEVFYFIRYEFKDWTMDIYK